MSVSALRRLDLNLLLVLAAVLETRNVTLAAAQLNMSQPSVSRALARLRDVFADELFVKGARGVIATPRALLLQKPLANLLALMESVIDTPAFDPTTTSRVFVIATTDYGALALLPQLSARLGRLAPNAGIDIRPFSPDAFRRLGEGDIDLVLYSDDAIPAGLHAEKLFDETYTSLVRANHPLLLHTRSKEISLDQFLAHPHVLVNVLGGRTGSVDEVLARLGHRRHIALWLPYFATAALVIARRDFILTLPDRAVQQLAGAMNLVSFTPPIPLDGYGYQMVWHERAHRDDGSIWLRQEVLRAAQSHRSFRSADR